jgi:ATP-dependent RNA helicase DDX49/DBP8
MKPSTLDKLIMSIWEQLHGSLQLDPQVVTEQWNEQRTITAASSAYLAPSSQRFSRVNMLCRKGTQASRCCSSLEVIVQAHWVACYDERVQVLADEDPQYSMTKHRMAVLKEACEDFGWTEKDLRNKIAVWRGYHEIEQAGRWAPLVFAGMGLYRYCKYRIDFSPEALARLNDLRSAFEVAADTLHPQWSQLLSIVDESTTALYYGHANDWVISEKGVIPLPQTYLQWDPTFLFEHLSESTIDEEVWGNYDPRSPPNRLSALVHREHEREKCGEMQSDVVKENNCTCLPNLYGGRRGPAPLQVFRTPSSKNNSLIASLRKYGVEILNLQLTQKNQNFPRGIAIGEFIGVITSSLNNLDCMQSSVNDGPTYQIFQGRKATSPASSTTPACQIRNTSALLGLACNK